MQLYTVVWCSFMSVCAVVKLCHAVLDNSACTHKCVCLSVCGLFACHIASAVAGEGVKCNEAVSLMV